MWKLTLESIQHTMCHSELTCTLMGQELHARKIHVRIVAILKYKRTFWGLSLALYLQHHIGCSRRSFFSKFRFRLERYTYIGPMRIGGNIVEHFRSEKETKQFKMYSIETNWPRFFNPRSNTISYSMPMKCFARSDVGPHRESESIASFTSKASLVIFLDWAGSFERLL